MHVSNKLLTNHHPSDDDIARSKKPHHTTLRYDGRLSKKGRRVDALALRAEERRDKLR